MNDRVQNTQKPQQKSEPLKPVETECQVKLIDVVQHWTANALHVRLKTRHSVVKRLRPYLSATGESLESPLTCVFTKEAFQNYYRVRPVRQSEQRQADWHPHFQLLHPGYQEPVQ